MTEQQITDKMAQLLRVGFVTGRQPEKMRLKVEFKDMPGGAVTSDWLPVLCPRACEDMQYDLPDIGDQVLCGFLANGLESGFVLGAMYGAKNPPVANGDKWHRKFKDGTWIEYDRAEHKLTASVEGDVEIKVKGNIKSETQGEVQSQSKGNTTVNSASHVTLGAPAISMGGNGGGSTEGVCTGNLRITHNLTVNGNVKIDGDCVISGISFLAHKHSCPHGGMTSPPVG